MNKTIHITPYPIDCYSYKEDVSRWSNKKLVNQLSTTKNDILIANRICTLQLTGKEFIELTEETIQKLRLTNEQKERVLNYIKEYKKISAINIIQRAIRYYKNKPNENEYLYRGSVTNDIITTEQNYVNTLQYVIENVKNPLTAKNKDVLNENEMKVLFSNIETVYQTNKTFCDDLTNRCKEYTPTTKIGDVFLQFIPFLKVYSEYCSNFRHTTEIIPTLKYPHKFAAFYSIVQRKSEKFKNSNIADLLITPVQRLPRYELLLKDLIKHTNPNHCDYQDLTKALEEINKVAKEVNEFSRKNELLEESENYLSNTLYLPDVQIIEQGRTLTKSIKVNGIGDRKYVALIYNDMIVIIKSQDGDYYTFKFLSYFKDLTVTEEDYKKNKNENYKSLKLKTGSKKTEQKIQLVFSSEKELNDFKNTLF